MIILIQQIMKLEKEFSHIIKEKTPQGLVLITGETLKIVSPKNTDSLKGISIDVLIEHELLNSEVYWKLVASNPQMIRYRDLHHYIESKEIV